MGDHIYVIVKEPIAYEHHGIYVGNNVVVHFINSLIKSSLESFADSKVVRIAPNRYTYTGYEQYNFFNLLTTNVTKRYSPKEVKMRALSKLGTGVYHLEDYNGEHFASWCKCGAYCSKMVLNYDLKRFASLVLGFDTMNMDTDRSFNEKKGELARV